MKKITVENRDYEIIEDNGECFDYETFKNLYTDYFYDYDYIMGDYAYNKLRLKGFCEKNNKKFNKINDYSNKNTYLKEECAYNCKYFVLKKVKKAWIYSILWYNVFRW